MPAETQVFDIDGVKVTVTTSGDPDGSILETHDRAVTAIAEEFATED